MEEELEEIFNNAKYNTNQPYVPVITAADYEDYDENDAENNAAIVLLHANNVSTVSAVAQYNAHQAVLAAAIDYDSEDDWDLPLYISSFPKSTAKPINLKSLTIHGSKTYGVCSHSTLRRALCTLTDVCVESCLIHGVYGFRIKLIQCDIRENVKCGVVSCKMEATQESGLVIICEDTTIHNNCTSGDKEDFGMFCEKDCNIRLITTEMEQTREPESSVDTKRRFAFDNNNGNNSNGIKRSSFGNWAGPEAWISIIDDEENFIGDLDYCYESTDVEQDLLSANFRFIMLLQLWTWTIIFAIAYLESNERFECAKVVIYRFLAFAIACLAVYFSCYEMTVKRFATAMLPLLFLMTIYAGTIKAYEGKNFF